MLAAFGGSQDLVRGNGWNVSGVIVLVYIAVVVASLLVAIIAAPLGSGGRALVQWGVNAAIAPVTALSASVLNFALKDIASPPGPRPVS